jgi:Flp pilus assembly protein TadD
MGIGAELDRAEALMNAGQVPEAVALLAKFVARKPKEVRALHLLGIAYAMTGEPRNAEECLRQASALKPRSAPILTDLAALLTSTKRNLEAVTLLETVRRRDPDLALAQFYHGVALSNLARQSEALEVFDGLSAKDPFNIVYRQNRAALLGELERFNEADAVADELLATNPAMLEPLMVKAVTATGRGNLSDALAFCDRIVARDRNHAGAIFHRAYVNLLLGQMAAGWPDYEARFQRDSVPLPLPDAPCWSGEPLRGRSLLVFAEQGLGDILMMCRYLPLIVEQGAEVTFLVRRAMFQILSGVADGVQFVDAVPADQRFDLQVGVMSLPRCFGTDLSTVPGRTPYLHADAERVGTWRQRLGDHGFKIGIAWQGNPNVKIDFGRSIPLREFYPLSQLPGVRLICLQKDRGLDQLKDMPAGMHVETLGEDFDGGPDAFVDTAAVMQNLDLIVTSDTAMVHLAGALRRPVWVALKAIPEWRWLLDRPDSPWYPDMRLFRQTKAGSWPDVFERIADELRQARA